MVMQQLSNSLGSSGVGTLAGRPKQRALAAELEKRAREEIGDGATALDYVVAWVASGKTQLKLVEEISQIAGMEIMHATMAKWLRDKFGEDATIRLEAARRDGAHVMVEDARGIIEDADNSSREKLQHAKMKADIRTWIAGKYNRDHYGDNKSTNISISVGGLHLAALRKPVVTAVVIEEPQEALGSIAGPDSTCTLPDAEILPALGAGDDAEQV